MLRRMQCVCGCDRDLSKKLSGRNFLAAAVALELLAWDKNRALSESGPEGREGLIARGIECYEQLLYSLHGEGRGDPDAECSAWLAESEKMRSGRADMTKKRFLRETTPNLSEDDLARLDRRHPARSFTGGEPGPDAPATLGAATAATVARVDLVEQLERLRALRDDDVLTEDEFAAAKARLLGGDRGSPPSAAPGTR